MDDHEEDFRVTAQSIEADADRLAEIEDEKKTLGQPIPGCSSSVERRR